MNSVPFLGSKAATDPEEKIRPREWTLENPAHDYAEINQPKRLRKIELAMVFVVLDQHCSVR